MSYVVVGHNGNGSGNLIESAQRNNDGSIVLTLPSAAKITKSFRPGIKAFKISVTTVVLASADATQGTKSDGEAVLDGYGPVVLTSNVAKP